MDDVESENSLNGKNTQIITHFIPTVISQDFGEETLPTSKMKKSG